MKKTLFIIDGSHWSINMKDKCFKSSSLYNDKMCASYLSILEDWVRAITETNTLNYKYFVDAHYDIRSMVVKQGREGVELNDKRQLVKYMHHIFENLMENNSITHKLETILNTLSYNVVLRDFKNGEKKCLNPRCNCVHKTDPIVYNVQCGVDTYITAKMVEMSCTGKVDQIILLSGDGDFSSGLDILANYGTQIVVVGNNISELLRNNPNCRCFEIPDAVYAEIKNSVTVLDYKYNPKRIFDTVFKKENSKSKIAPLIKTDSNERAQGHQTPQVNQVKKTKKSKSKNVVKNSSSSNSSDKNNRPRDQIYSTTALQEPNLNKTKSSVLKSKRVDEIYNVDDSNVNCSNNDKYSKSNLNVPQTYSVNPIDTLNSQFTNLYADDDDSEDEKFNKSTQSQSNSGNRIDPIYANVQQGNQPNIGYNARKQKMKNDAQISSNLQGTTEVSFNLMKNYDKQSKSNKFSKINISSSSNSSELDNFNKDSRKQLDRINNDLYQ